MQLREALESFIETSSAKTAEEEERVAQAGRLLTEVIRLEGRARRLFGADPLWELGYGRTFGVWEARDPSEASGQRRARTSKDDPSLAGLSLHEAARRVLQEEGRPMHVQELGVRIKARGWRHPRSRAARPDQINYQLAARLPRHSQTFRRVAPNTFGLTAWGDRTPHQERLRPRLPLVPTAGTAPDGRPWSEWIGDHPEAPVEDETAAWRSS